MNLGLLNTVMKFRNAAPALAVGTSSERRGSLNSSSTAKNIRNTLSAATRNTLSTRRCWCTQEATYGPAAPTTQGFTSATPNAGRVSTNPTSSHSGTALRTGESHDDPSDPSRKYERLKMK